jgi:hypothetical protein
MKKIEVPLKDCIYGTLLNYYKWGDIIISRRWGNRYDYWGFLGEDGNEFEVKFI